MRLRRNYPFCQIALMCALALEVDDHGTFQNAESNLHLCHPDAEPTIKDIQEYWDLVNAFVADLKLTTRYGSLLQRSQELSHQLSDEKLSATIGLRTP